jgi:hypothetical protein
MASDNSNSKKIGGNEAENHDDRKQTHDDLDKKRTGDMRDAFIMLTNIVT